MVWLIMIEDWCMVNWTTCVPNHANKHIIVNYTIGPNTISESGMALKVREKEKRCVCSVNVHNDDINIYE